MDLNKQNKKHFALFHNPDQVDQAEWKVSWTDSFFNMNDNRLNKRLAKISPRRGKASKEPTEAELIEAITEMFK